MNNKKLLALFGLKWNPFLPNLPVEALWHPPEADVFFFRVENLVMDGGFAMICGEPGVGKSKILQLLANRVHSPDDIVVGTMERPQSGLSDFYREMGDLFGVNLSVANRYGGFKALRERWRNHMNQTLFRPLLLIDEAQEMESRCMNELRFLGSANFDSECLLTIVLCGDMRLPERFRSNALVSLGTRIRARMKLEPYDQGLLLEYLEHMLQNSGAPHLMTQPLKETLVDHAAGNLRVLNIMAAELLEKAAQQEASQLDEKLFLQTYSRHPASRRRPSKPKNESRGNR